jgi:hypothetical protein
MFNLASGKDLRRKTIHVIDKGILGFYESQKEILASANTHSARNSIWIHCSRITVSSGRSIYLYSFLKGSAMAP